MSNSDSGAGTFLRKTEPHCCLPARLICRSFPILRLDKTFEPAALLNLLPISQATQPSTDATQCLCAQRPIAVSIKNVRTLSPNNFEACGRGKSDSSASPFY